MIKPMQLSQVNKLNLSNFLTGLVFWYGIEKLFMTSIGIDAVGIGIVTAVSLGFNLLFDIPAGMLADRWSRKGVLMISALSLAAASLVLGSSKSLNLYIAGYLLYGLYVVATSGTYQAIMYDSLHELGKHDQYSKLAGRSYALFLAGAGVANVLSGFIASSHGLRLPFMISVVPCIINIVVLASLTEPAKHKTENKERIIPQLKEASLALAKVRLLRGLAIIMCTLTIVELFKADFGQLYILRYVSKPEVLGLLWAAYAFTWSLGSLIAHRLHARLNTLVILSVAPLLLMAFIDNWFSLVLFMVQAVASAALFNQIETRIQDATPSHVRASVLSVLTSVGRMVSIPASFLLGWLIRSQSAFWGLRFVAGIATLALIYWFFLKQELSTLDKQLSSNVG